MLFVTDPVYPVYVDSNIMAGREIVYATSNEANGFAALPDENVKADIIYLAHLTTRQALHTTLNSSRLGLTMLSKTMQ